MNKKIEQILEFQKIRNQVAQYTTSELGNQLVQQLPILTKQQAIQHQIDETTEGVSIQRLRQGIPIPRLKDIARSIKRLELEAALNGSELSQISQVLLATRDVTNFFEKLSQENIFFPKIQELVDKLNSLPELTKQLQLSIREDGFVLDEASPMLKGIRQGIQKNEQAVRQQLDQYISGKMSHYLTDNLVTIRNDRFVVPVKAEYRNSFGGTVHDQSATGQTVFIEPQAIVNLNNRLQELHGQEKIEISRILWELSQSLMPYTEELKQNQYVLGRLDVVNAKALYAKSIKATKPLLNEKNEMVLWQARHPLIDLRNVVANDILLGKEYEAIVITGPNTGGKTILLKTLGLIQLMAQSGLYIPANEGSQVGIFTEVFADIGDEQSIEQNLSTFSSHMSSIVNILETMDQHSLILLDEIGSGTDPQEGASLAIAILDYIASKQAFVVATTHYPELKAYGYNRPKTINASMEFDGESLQPTYRFLLGVPGRSNAFDISKRLGLPESIILQARGMISVDKHDLNEMIADLEGKRRKIEMDQDTLNLQMKESEELLDLLKYETTQFFEQKERLIEEAKEKANQLIETSQSQAESILSDIRNMQLESKQQTFKEHELIEKRSAFSQLKHERELKKNKVLLKEKAKKALRVGQQVEVSSFGQRGTLQEKISDKEWIVQIGMLKMKVSVDDFLLLEEEKKTSHQVILRSKSASHVSSELDVRGERYEAALKSLDSYLDAAILAGYARVTIIHGRGTGALQKGVHQALKQHRSVKDFEFAPMNVGGNGATIVTFK